MASLSITEVQLAGLFIEAAAWGIQLVTFTFSVCTLSEKARKSRRRPLSPLLIYAFTLFIIGTLDVSFSLRETLESFGSMVEEGTNWSFKQPQPYYVLVLRVRFLWLMVGESRRH